MKDTMNILKEAWEKLLTTDYEHGVLSYERDLQAAFYHHVRILSRDGLVLFNEVPDFLGYRKPDLVVCRGSVVEAVIEIKFEVSGVDSTDDLGKLARWANAVRKTARKIPLALDPKTVTLDNDDGRRFMISDKTNWVFAVVTQAGWDAVSSVATKRRLASMRKNVPWSRFWHFTGIVNPDGKLRFAARHL